MRSEFEFIRNIKEKYGLGRVGDDCAVLPKDARTDMVVTADLLVEDIDFRLEWTRPQFLGHKALAVSLSDVAAMGASPGWALLTLAVPTRIWKGEWVDKFFTGWFKLAKQFGVELVGGDVSRSGEKLVIDSIVAGEIKRGTAIARSGASPGDLIFVTGSLGGAAGGLDLLESGHRYSESKRRQRRLIERQLRPVPRIEVGRTLAQQKLATAMIDISDGFSSDLAHICRASKVGARIETIPVNVDLQAEISPDHAFQKALHGGEDFELLFTVNKRSLGKLDKIPATMIGTITDQANVIELNSHGRTRKLEPKGFRHF